MSLVWIDKLKSNLFSVFIEGCGFNISVVAKYLSLPENHADNVLIKNL